MFFSETWSRTERAILCVALAIIIILGIRTMASIIDILLVSMILALLTYPAIKWLNTKGVSHTVAVAIVTGAAVLCIVLIVYLTVLSFGYIINDLPLYQAELSARLNELVTLLGLGGISLAGITGASLNLTTIVPMLLSSVMNLGEDLMYVFFIAVTTFFILLEAPLFIGRIETLLADDQAKLRQLSKMSGYVIDFIVVRTETNMIHGFLFGGSLALMGVHGAILWGILTFLLGYIPYFGLIIAAVPAIFFAWLQFGIWGAVAVVAIVCVLNLIVENPVFSYLAARKFEIPALVVVLSVIFWGWLFGLAGMLFAVPFTLMLVILIEASGEFRWINTLMGVSHLFEEVLDKKTDEKKIP
ncbi:MAG: AI-2E family transporter [Methanoregula sp.]|nr:AI-2E family transporter [Methanoregula sp.]